MLPTIVISKAPVARLTTTTALADPLALANRPVPPTKWKTGLSIAVALPAGGGSNTPLNSIRSVSPLAAVIFPVPLDSRRPGCSGSLAGVELTTPTVVHSPRWGAQQAEV